MRHTGAGLAIPDFPLMFGHLVPDHWDPKIAGAFRPPRRRARRRRSSCSALSAFLGRGTAIGASSSAPRRFASRALSRTQVTLGALTDPEPPGRVDQQRARRLRRARADDVAGDYAAKLAVKFRGGSRSAGSCRAP